MSNSHFLFTPEGVELSLLFFPLDNRTAMRPTTERLSPQWSILSVGWFLGFLTTRAMKVSHESTPLISLQPNHVHSLKVIYSCILSPFSVCRCCLRECTFNDHHVWLTCGLRSK
ncbi:hypothetical protein AVEN_39797-1 [Araneus ventricosus]|uniref:Uncharacterized protein n=1 Tax=Araneus ventricosus TaxID=182803 RepID=A0A4Y2S5G4_ARAVE|nr:hypothetical protein AVEN_39797-1 [Araneus ventricosus]